jgi:DNA mismatch repair protein MutL
MEALLDNPPSFAALPRLRTFFEEQPEKVPAFPGELHEEPPAYGRVSPLPDKARGGLNYLGRLFGLFILAERGDVLYIIDQHAAHERILYDRFHSKPIPRQELLAPIPFSTDSVEEDNFLSGSQADLERLGIQLSREGGSWQIDALPANWRMGDGETVKEILSLRTAGENMAERWLATLSCHSAVKDGDYLDQQSALALAEQALELPIPRCPHGRPVWKEISRDELFRAVHRK